MTDLFSVAFERATAAIVIVEGNPPVRVHCNERAIEIFGRPIDPSGGTHQYQPQMHDRHGVALLPAELPSARALRGETVVGEEFLVRQPSGAYVPIRGSAIPVRDSVGGIAGGVGVFEDISSEKELEHLRRDWNAVLAHDLSQPVSAISVLASLLAERGDTSRELMLIRSACERVLRLVGDVEDATAMETQQLQLRLACVDPGAIVNECAERWSLAHPGATVRVIGAPTPTDVSCDPARIQQVLDNLIANAIKYGDGTSPIDVSVATRDDEIEVSVANAGDGIAADELPFIFERYRRTAAARDRTRGLGLGLYIARGLIAAHGGRLSVESVPGVTTTFRFTIPRHKEAR